MHSNAIHLPAAAWALLCALAPTAEAAAADAAESTPPTAIVEEVVVTARKREEALSDVPAAITVLDRAGIRARGLAELNQLEKFAPNVVQTHFGQGNTGHAGVFIRGIGMQDHIITTDPAVGIYLDGVYLGRNMGANMDLTNIERVEMARGPQGSLSGRNTLGGAINIVTRKPSGEGVAHVDVKAGSRGRLDGNAFADVALGGNASLALSAGGKSRDGVGRALLIDDPQADIGEIGQGFGRVALRWQGARDIRIQATADLSRSDQGVSPHEVQVVNADNPFGLRQADQPPNPDDTFSLNNELTATRDRTRGVSLSVDWDIADRLRLSTIASYRDMWFAGGLDNEKVAATLMEFPERGEADQRTLEVRLGGVAEGVDWVAGLYLFNEAGYNDSPFVFRTTPAAGEPLVIPTADFDGRLYVEQQTNSSAVYAHANVDLSPRWTLGFGVRRTRDEKDGLGRLHYFAAPAERRDSWAETTGDISLTLRLRPGLNVFASYARGYQAGGYPPRPFAGPQVFVAFDPTFADSFELGVKGAFADRLELNAAAFHVRYTDLAMQVSELIGQGFLTLTRNAAESVATGVELEGVWQTTPNFDVAFALGYINVEIAAVDAGVLGVKPGDSPALVPKTTASLSPRYVRVLRSGAEMTARLDYYHRGRMFGQPVNSVLNEMAAVRLANVNLAWISPARRWRLSLYGHNIGNERYPLAKLDLDPTVLIINSNDRREFGIRLGRTFGGN